MDYYDPKDYTTVHNKHLERLQIDASSEELTRLRLIEAAARAVVESAGTYPSRALYADIEALRQALNTKGG